MSFDFSKRTDRLLRSSKFGEAVVITSPQGAAVTISDAGWKDGELDTRKEDGRQVRYRTAQVSIRLTDHDGPEARGTARRVATGEDWSIVYVDKPRGAKWLLHVERAVVTDQTAGQYR